MAYFDIHSHILQGVDDGSPDIENSVKLLNAEVENGVTAVALTPHFYPDTADIGELFNTAVERFKALTRAIPDMPLDIVLGSEVRYFRNISSTERIKRLCIGGTEYMLLELPYNTEITEYAVRDISEMYYSLGIKPILAHVERYAKVKGFSNLIDIIDGETVFAEVNAGSVFDGCRKDTIKLIKSGIMYVMASDAHSVAHRPPKIKAAFNELCALGLEAEVSKFKDNSLKLYNEIFSEK